MQKERQCPNGASKRRILIRLPAGYIKFNSSKAEPLLTRSRLISGTSSASSVLLANLWFSIQMETGLEPIGFRRTSAIHHSPHRIGEAGVSRCTSSEGTFRERRLFDLSMLYDYMGAKDNKIYSLAAGRSKVLPSREHDGNTGYLKSKAVAHSSELLP